MIKRFSNTFFLLLLFVMAAASACANVKATPFVTAMNYTATPSMAPNDQNLETYDSKLWKLLFDKDMVVQIDVAPNEEIWMITESGNVVFGDKEHWKIFSHQDFTFTNDLPSDMAITSSGVVWIASRHAISRYFDGKWNTIEIPNFSETAFPRLAVSHDDVWIAMSSCYCENSLRYFDGNQWNDVSIDSLSVEAHQVAIDVNDKLWVTFGDGTGIASFDGSSWRVYKDTDIWSGYPHFTTRIAVDDQGNAYSLNEDPLWIGQIDAQGNIRKIPFDKNLYLDETRIRLFIDARNNIWLNACLKDQGNSCISYYDGRNWTSFTNLPFSTLADINQLENGIMLFATEKGLYSYVPSE